MKILSFLSLFFSALSFLLSWLLPNHYLPWRSAHQEFLSFLSCGLLFLGAMPRVIKVDVCFLAVLCLCFLVFVQYLFGIIFYIGDVLVVCFFLLLFGFSYLFSFSYVLGAGRAGKLAFIFAYLFLFGALVSFYIGLSQWLQRSDTSFMVHMPVGGRVYANLAQPNNLATLFCIGIAATIYFYEKFLINRMVGGLLVFVLVVGVSLTQSRTPWMMALGLCVFWFLKSRDCSMRLRPSVLLLWVIIYAFIVSFQPMVSEVLYLSSRTPGLDMHSEGRLDLYKQFYLAVIHGPPLGYGWNQVTVAQVAITPIFSVAVMTEYTHNILLDLLIWNGPVIGGVIIISAALWLGRLVWVARSSESLFALLVTGFLLVHGMLEYPHAYAYFLLPLGLLLGIAQAEHVYDKVFMIPRCVIAGMLVIVAGIGSLTWFEYRIIEEDFRLMRFEAANIGALKAEQSESNVKLLTQLREFIRFARAEVVDNMSDEDLMWMRKVSHRYPYLPNLYRYSFALALNGHAEEAVEELKILRGLYGEQAFSEVLSLLESQAKVYPQLDLVLRRLDPKVITQ